MYKVLRVYKSFRGPISMIFEIIQKLQIAKNYSSIMKETQALHQSLVVSLASLNRIQIVFRILIDRVGMGIEVLIRTRYLLLGWRKVEDNS